MSVASELVMRCFHARTNGHILHLQTRSYAQHKALNEFYDSIVEVTDAFAEAYQGRFGIMEDLNMPFELAGEPIPMLNDLRTWIDDNRSKATKNKAELENLVDSILDLIDSTIYKLRFLR